MSPTTRTAIAVAALCVAALLVPLPLVLAGLGALVAAVVVDAAAVRRPPHPERSLPSVLSRGVRTELTVDSGAPLDRVELRQPAPVELAVAPATASGRLDGSVLPRRRGRYVWPPAAVRVTGPLGLARWHHRVGEDEDVLVYPDLPAARRLALAARRGRFGEAGRQLRGPLGLGTDFESIRDYQPDDDIRQVNWPATVRMQRPMSNQYRVDQDRDVVLAVDTGRLMAAPLGGDRNRLDAALDAAAAVALVADEMGDRCGALAFDAQVRRRLAPRRSGGSGVVRALFDLEPAAVDSDYELAFRTLGGGKRSLVMVFTDLLEESAARPLVEAVPVLARRHAVVVATVADPDLDGLVATAPERPADAFAAAVALGVLRDRTAAAAQLRAAGAGVVEAPPSALAAACVRAYLTAKARARL